MTHHEQHTSPVPHMPEATHMGHMSRMTQTLGMTSEVMYISKVTVSKVTRMPKVAHLVCIKVTHAGSDTCSK